MVVKFCPAEVVSPANMLIHSVCISLQFICNRCGSVGYLHKCVLRQSKSIIGIQKVYSNFSSFAGSFFMLLPLLLKKNYMLTSCDIFSPAATIACTRSAERKQSGYCVPLGWPAPILRVPTPPTMTTRGIDMHCSCICASAILWSPQVVPRPSLIYP